MLIFIKKTLSITHFGIIRKPSFSKRCVVKYNIHHIQSSVFSKNKLEAEWITQLINQHSSQSFSNPRSFFHEDLLWRMIDFKNSSDLLYFLTSSSHKLLSIFEDVEDLVSICKYPSSYKTLTFLCDDSKRLDLLSRFDSSDIIRIARNFVARSVFEFLLEDDNWDVLYDRLGYLGIVRIASIHGAKHVFQILIKTSNWLTLKSRIGVDGIIKIGGYRGCNLVFSMFLDNPTWFKLIQRLDLFSIVNISLSDSSTPALKILLNDDFWGKIQTRLSRFDLVRIAQRTASHLILRMVCDTTIWEKLMLRIGKYVFLKIAQSSAARCVLNYLLDDNNWHRMHTTLTKQDIDVLSKNRGSSLLLNIGLPPFKWKDVSDSFESQGFVRITPRPITYYIKDVQCAVPNTKFSSNLDSSYTHPLSKRKRKLWMEMDHPKKRFCDQRLSHLCAINTISKTRQFTETKPSILLSLLNDDSQPKSVEPDFPILDTIDTYEDSFVDTDGFFDLSKYLSIDFLNDSPELED